MNRQDIWDGLGALFALSSPFLALIIIKLVA